jgi:ribosomal-protein-alanine N-acetyltransferase
MEFYPSTLTQAESDAFVDRIEAHFDETGFGLWAVELVSSGEFAGYVGLWPATFESHFTPAIEVGWRLARRFWGAGLAPEAARPLLTMDSNGLVSTRSSRSRPRSTSTHVE